MPKSTVAFGNLYAACIKRGLHARLHTYDGGQTITITGASGERVFQWESDWGGDTRPVDEAVEWLLEQGYIEAADLEG